MKNIIPVRGSIAGHCYYEQTDRNIVWGSFGINQGTSDILPYIGGGLIDPNQMEGVATNLDHRIVYLRILKPHFAPIVDMYLDLECQMSGSNGLKVALTTVDGFEPVSLNQNQINAMWRQIKGNDNPIGKVGNKIKAEGLNLKTILPIGGSNEMFGLVLAFDSNPQNFKINKLKILLGTEQLV